MFINQRKSLIALPVVLLAATLTITATGCQKKEATSKEGGAGAASAAPQPASVQVTPARSETVLELVPVTGSIQALQTVELLPKVIGRVISVAGREGSTVQQGQVVVQQDTADLQRQVDQARANVDTARSRLSQAQTNYQNQLTTSDVAVRNAQEQVRGAQAQLALTRRPQRSQEVVVAENNVKTAQANYDKAKSDRERYEQLYKEGATPAITLDQYVTQEKVAQTALGSAKQQLQIAREGGRSESIRQQEAAVAQAGQALRQAQANRSQVAVRQEDITSARASLEQAQAALAVAERAVQDASLRSPINGVISDRKVEPGQLASPGQSVAQIIALNSVFFEAQINETDLSGVRAGQPVQVHIDAYPNKTFSGRVARVYPAGNTTGRTFTARVEIPNTSGALLPGLFVRGEIVTARHPNSVTAPVAAIIRTPDSETAGKIFTVENGVARERNVQLSLSTPDSRRYVVNGIQPGENIVVAGQRAIKDGDRVNAEPAQDTRAAAEKYTGSSGSGQPGGTGSGPSASGGSAPSGSGGSDSAGAH